LVSFTTVGGAEVKATGVKWFVRTTAADGEFVSGGGTGGGRRRATGVAFVFCLAGGDGFGSCGWRNCHHTQTKPASIKRTASQYNSSVPLP
jgi:hypothetical protein